MSRADTCWREERDGHVEASRRFFATYYFSKDGTLLTNLPCLCQLRRSQWFNTDNIFLSESIVLAGLKTTAIEWPISKRYFPSFWLHCPYPTGLGRVMRKQRRQQTQFWYFQLPPTFRIRIPKTHFNVILYSCLLQNGRLLRHFPTKILHAFLSGLDLQSSSPVILQSRRLLRGFLTNVLHLPLKQLDWQSS